MSRRKAPAASVDPALVLPAELTIYTARDVQAQWLAWLGPAGATADEQAVVRAQAVGDIDGAGVQLLLALDRSLSERGRRLQIHGPSSALQVGCGAAGLADWLQERAA